MYLEIEFTYIIHNCNIDIFKHLLPDIISFTLEYVMKKDVFTFGILNLVPSHNTQEASRKDHTNS